MSEIIKIWLANLYEEAIEDTKGTIANNHLCVLGAANEEEEQMFIQNEIEMKEYLEVLEELKANLN